jgi:hypothetical protein
MSKNKESSMTTKAHHTQFVSELSTCTQFLGSINAPVLEERISNRFNPWHPCHRPDGMRYYNPRLHILHPSCDWVADQLQKVLSAM